jgi:hypothetical protein
MDLGDCYTTKEGLLRVAVPGRRRIDSASLDEFRKLYGLTKSLGEDRNLASLRPGRLVAEARRTGSHAL